VEIPILWGLKVSQTISIVPVGVEMRKKKRRKEKYKWNRATLLNVVDFLRSWNKDGGNPKVDMNTIYGWERVAYGAGHEEIDDADIAYNFVKRLREHGNYVFETFPEGCVPEGFSDKFKLFVNSGRYF
jgi:hypothetical protein